MKLFIHIVLSCIVILIFSRTYASVFSVDFFNVGQGNCTFCYFGKSTPVLLVDAGSSAIDKSVCTPELESFKKLRISEIYEKTINKIPKN